MGEMTKGDRLEPLEVLSPSTSVSSSSMQWQDRCILTAMVPGCADAWLMADSFFQEAGFSDITCRECTRYNTHTHTCTCNTHMYTYVHIDTSHINTYMYTCTHVHIHTNTLMHRLHRT